jgi:PfaD family protein
MKIESKNIATNLAKITKPLFINDKLEIYSKLQANTIAIVPACHPKNFGDVSFCEDYNLDFPYIADAMANGISSVEMVIAMANANMLGVFGAAGLSKGVIERAILSLNEQLVNKTWGINLIYSPHEPELEKVVVDLCLNNNVDLVCASAYLDLSLEVVRYRVKNIYLENDKIIVPNRVIAKVSRIEIAEKFLSPPPENMLQKLLELGEITAEQVILARQIPVAQDLTVEADSGGHTDNRPLVTMLPTMLSLRERLHKKYNYKMPLRIGAAGGISTPQAANGAFAMGADYIITGSVNQACLEVDTSDKVRELLAKTEQADVTMAPAADMFEMGVKLQVIKRGTMFAMRSQKLYDFYKNYKNLDEIPLKDKRFLEKTIFHAPIAKIWQDTQDFWNERDPQQIKRANNDGKHKMALLFRWYLGLSSIWAKRGEATRYVDYQIWCGPSMGAFNEWTKNSFLADWQNRRIVTVALNILYGAALLNRANVLRLYNVPKWRTYLDLTPLEAKKIKQYI